jgi:RNA polymerase subunit RPABC4/transcription elongation factor Spt4
VKRAVKEAKAVTKRRDCKRICPALTVAKAKRAWRGEVEVVEDETSAGGMKDYCSVFQ